MLRLARYLKPFSLLVVVAIILLFMQAITDLSLPDYMARIVNIGIQQGGIEDAVPGAIRQSEMDRLMLFMDADEQVQVLQHYTLVDHQSPDYRTYVEDYPALADQPIYVLGDVSGEDIDRLNPILGLAFLALSGVERTADGGASADPSTLPAEARQRMLDMIEQTYAPTGTSGMIQAAVPAIKAEYVALGLDTGSLQTRYIVKTGLSMLLLALVSAACTVAVGLLAAWTAAGVARDLRRDVFEKIGLPMM
jgi:ATP-binding cassette subfamily B multidrug efflux pump